MNISFSRSNNLIHFILHGFARFFVLLVILVAIAFSANSQKLTLADLLNISKKENWVDVNETLIKKGWEYFGSSKGDDDHYSTITWSFNKQSYNDKAQGWFYLYTYEGFPNKVSLILLSKEQYNSIKSAITSSGMKLIDSSIDNNRIETKYANGTFIVSVNTEKHENEESYGDSNSQTIYRIDVANKSGVYDPDNGLKRYYDSAGNLETELTLKDGKLNGIAKSFYSDGTLQMVSYFLNGDKNGVSKEYDMNGNLKAESKFVNGVMTGPYKKYENGKLKVSGTMVDGKRNGYIKVYNSDGLIDIEYEAKNDFRDGKYIEYYYDKGVLNFKITGQYLKGDENGRWLTFKIDSTKSEIFEFKNYNLGVLEGLFKDVRKDSIIFGSYQDGVLHGPYSIYKSMTAWLFGTLDGDTTNSPLIANGYYSKGLKTGNWKHYSEAKKLLREGEYENDRQTGTWKYYYDNYIDENGKKLPYSNELYLVENYNEGELNGKSTRYSYLERVQVNCDPKLNDNVNPLDTCYQWVHRKILETSYYKGNKLHGSYELRDSINTITEKGDYINEEKNGPWIERYSGSYEGPDSKIWTVYHKGSYLNGDRHGVWSKHFDLNQPPFATYTYYNGIFDGKATMVSEEKYFEYGRLKKVITFDSLGVKDGTYDITSTGADLKCERILFIKEGKIQEAFSLPLEYEDWANYFSFTNRDVPFTVILATKSYNNGRIAFFDKNDKIQIDGFLIRDQKVGLWKQYHYDQDIYTNQEFNDGKGGEIKFYKLSSNSLFSGNFEQRYSNGNLNFQIKISNGVRNGISKYFTEDGKLEKTEKYKQGILQN